MAKLNVIRPSLSKNLVQYFDCPKLNDNFPSSSIKTTGLFGYPSFQTPRDFLLIAQKSIQISNGIVQQVCMANTQKEILKTVKRLDLLSDVLCQVTDAAQLIRSVHTDEKFVSAAEQVQYLVGNYMNELNTHSGIYQALLEVLKLSPNLSQQERMAAQLLKNDLQKSGIQMSSHQKAEFIYLNEKIRDLGYQFIENAGPTASTMILGNSAETLQGIPDFVLEKCKSFYSSSKNAFLIPSRSNLLHSIQSTCRNEEIRKQIYVALNSGTRHQIQVLEELLSTRASLAKLLGAKSYGDLFLQDKLAKNPQNVLDFLKKLSDSNMPLVQDSLKRLLKMKQSHTRQSQAVLQPWDIPFYSQFANQGYSSQSLSEYFSLGRVMQGLNDILSDFFGISLEPEELLYGETWHPQVRKLKVLDDNLERIGTIYCDFFTREPGARPKMDESAHFTIRCSRRMDNAIEQEQDLSFLDNLCEKKSFYDANHKTHSLYQLPIVVLTLGFPIPTDNQPSLLTLEQVETLFHEMGHAVHTMLSRTDYQHISGTRVPLDFVEVPSTFMETFLTFPNVTTRFAKHYKTDEPLHASLYEDVLNKKKNMSFILENQAQIKLAVLDQMYHSSEYENQGLDSTQIHAMVQSEFYPVPFLPQVASQVHFSHLFMYGSIYYSYFWSRKCADRLHRQLTRNGDPHEWLENGKLLSKELFGLGYSRDPWVGLENLGITPPLSSILFV